MIPPDDRLAVLAYLHHAADQGHVAPALHVADPPHLVPPCPECDAPADQPCQGHCPGARAPGTPPATSPVTPPLVDLLAHARQDSRPAWPGLAGLGGAGS